MTRDQVRAKIHELLTTNTEFVRNYFTGSTIHSSLRTALLDKYFNDDSTQPSSNYTYIVIYTETFPNGVLSEEIPHSEFGDHIDVLEGVLNETWDLTTHGRPNTSYTDEDLGIDEGIRVVTGYTEEKGEFFGDLDKKVLIAIAAATVAEEQIQGGAIPIGGIIRWYFYAPAYNSNWVQCDGSRIYDSESPMHLNYVPNLPTNYDEHYYYIIRIK